MTIHSLFKGTPSIVIYGFFILTGSAYGQHTFHGVVQDVRGEKLPGVNVVEKGTSNGTNTDGDGVFSITSTVKNPTLVFSFIGLLTQEISASPETPMLVTMLDDEKALSEPTYCYCLSRYSDLGISPGINYGRIGFRAMNFTPYIAGVRINTTSSIEWRRDSEGARYLAMYLRRNQLFYTSVFTGGIYGEYKTFQANPAAEIKEVNIAPELTFSRFRLAIGYTRQEISSESNTVTDNGYYFGSYFLVAQQFSVDLKAKYVNDQMQYDLRVSEDIPNSKFSIGAGYEKIDSFEEVSMTLLYRIFY